MVVLVLVGGGQVRPVLAAAEIVGHVGVLVVVDLGIVAVLLAHGQALLPPDNRPICCSAVGGGATSPRSLASESLSLPEPEESMSSPLSMPESEESLSSPVSPSPSASTPVSVSSARRLIFQLSAARFLNVRTVMPNHGVRGLLRRWGAWPG
jgi:hypothetical protein